MTDEITTGQENQSPDLTADESTVLPAEQASPAPHIVFDEETFTPAATDEEPDYNNVKLKEVNPAYIPPPDLQKQGKKKTTKPPPTPPKKSRETKTLSFNLTEFQYIDEVFKARKESGLNEDYNQFLRQCVDFAVNHDAVKGKLFSQLSFARPDMPHQFLNNAFYNKTK
jgi:hypothetical protein